ncbi:MAG: YciI family protein [Aurantibacter sp.]
MQEFLLLLKGDGMNHLSPAELQGIMGDYKAWVAQLGDKYLGGQRLEDRGAFLISKNADILTDGPFLESKEIIAGYFLIQAKDQDEANKIALSSPHLGLYAIEVRPLAFPKMK